MKKITWKAVSGIFAVLFLFMSLTACSSINSDRQIKDYKDKGNQSEIARPDPDATPVPEEREVSNFAGIGEEIWEPDIQNGKEIPDALVYTVNKTTLFSDIAEAGIVQEDMVPFIEDSLLDEKGELKSGVKFLLFEMTVKNIRAEPMRNITSLNLLYADSITEISDKTSTMSFLDLPCPAYFSNPSGSRVGDEWKEYYTYNVPVGQSKNIKVGWYVDLDQYDQSNLYLIFNRDNDEEKLFKLYF